jgi:predicted ArsR family transcriptional regulator
MPSLDKASDNVCEMVLELLKEEADMDGVVIVPAAYIGEKLGISGRAAGRATSQLTAKGVLEFIGTSDSRGRTQMYQLQNY